MEKKIITILVILGIIAIIGSQSIYTVHQTEMAIVLQLGEPVRDVQDPGLHFKLPFIQNVVYLDARILTYDATRASAYTKDNKNIVLDNFTRWRIKKKPTPEEQARLEAEQAARAALAAEADLKAAEEARAAGQTDEEAANIADAAALATADRDLKRVKDTDSDALKFYKTQRTVTRAQDRIGDIVNSELRVVIGRYTLTEVITTKRQEIMSGVIVRANVLAGKYGIEIVDVRIKRADLPETNQMAVFDRMRAERERLAIQYRSEGDEEATKIKSAADYERTRILAEARRQAQELKGAGDAESIRIFADALSTSPEFYEFSRSLEAYKNSLKENTRLLLPLGSEYLKYFN